MTIHKFFKAKTDGASLNDHAISAINIHQVATHIITRLQQIPTGTAHANDYHKLMKGALELIFYPHLMYPVVEQEIHHGRKRIDIVFDNAAREGFFYRLPTVMRIPSQFIFIECKNYSSDPANPELDQLAGRFSPNRGQMGFLTCRSFVDAERFIDRCRDTYRDNRGLIVPLEDEDIITLLEHAEDENFKNEFISARVRKIAIN